MVLTGVAGINNLFCLIYSNKKHQGNLQKERLPFFLIYGDHT